MATLLIVSALRQLITGVGAGHIGIEVGGVIGQQTATHQLLFLPQTQQAPLRQLQRVFGGHGRILGLGQNELEGIPESLGGKTLGGEIPLRGENGLRVPIWDFGLRTGITDAVNGGQQEIVGGAGAGAGRGPKGLQEGPKAALLGDQP